MPKDIPIKFRWSEQCLLTEDTEWQRRECVCGSACFLLLGIKHLCGAWRPGAGGSCLDLARGGWKCSSLHRCSHGGRQGWEWHRGGTAGKQEIGFEHKRLLLIICIRNIVWFSSVCSQSMSLFTVLGNFCENLLMIYWLGKRSGFFVICFCVLFVVLFWFFPI